MPTEDAPPSAHLPPAMAACRIARFGGSEVLKMHDLPRPIPGPGQVLVRVKAAGVGPWDALIRSGRSALVTEQFLPLTLGSDLAGVVDAVGDGVDALMAGDAVYGVTNRQFIGAYAEFALAEANMLALKPRRLNFIEAAAMPVVAVTAWQMLFEHARLEAGQAVLVLGGSGSVGACAVQLARRHGAQVIATTLSGDSAAVRTLGADAVIDLREGGLERSGLQVDVVIDTVGGALQSSAWPLIKRGGSFISAVSAPDESLAKSAGAHSAFFYVDVGTANLNRIAALLDAGALTVRVGTVLPLHHARQAHEMLDGLRPRPAGKIVLAVES